MKQNSEESDLVSIYKEMSYLLLEAYGARSWHGPSLRGSLRSVTVKQALWRPARGRHNIWELTLHAAYWKFAVRRRLVSRLYLQFPIKGNNWFIRSEGTEEEWKRDLKILRHEHNLLAKTVMRRSAAVLRSPKVSRMVIGIALHDVYHAGQISLIKRLMARN
jgi:hypothetical protein